MEEKKHGAWVIIPKDKAPADSRRGEIDEEVKEAIRRDGCRKVRRKIVRYFK